MRRVLLAVIAGGALALAACAAEVETRPAVVYESEPPLAEVEPGVQVVADSDDEVFVYGGTYWTQRGGVWWRSPDYHGHWVRSEPTVVPERIRTYPAGRYRRYHR